MSNSSQSPILCLVGAGSNPDLLTSHLTSDLLSWDGFRESRASDPSWAVVGQGEGDRRVPYFTWLAGLIARVAGKANTLNFEDLIHVLEVVASQGYVGFQDSAWNPSDYGAGLLELNEAGKAVAAANPRFVAEQTCYYILQRVQERTRDVPPSDASLLLRRLRDAGHLLRVFSLNYDSLVVGSLSEPLWTGFNTDVSAASEFLLEPQYPVDRDLHIQLHGSTNFGLAPDGFDPVTRIRRWNDGSPVATWGMTSGSYRDETLDGHVTPAVPMITGRRKADRILSEPFSSYVHYLRHAAFSTPNWLILGYGAADPHVNSIFESATRHHGARLRIAVCNWLPWHELNGASRTDISPGGPFTEHILGLRGFAAPFVDQAEFYSTRGNVFAYIDRDTANELNSNVIATVDGRYERHADELEQWFNR